MNRKITFRLPENLYIKIKESAKASNVTVSHWIVAILSYILSND